MKDVVPLPKPYVLFIDPSSICNFKCKQCFHSNDNYNDAAYMELELFKKIIDDLKNWDSDCKIKSLKLYNHGEPLLNANICDFIEIAKKADIADKIEITTNAAFLSEKVIKALIDNEVDYLRVSIYSPIQEINEKVTGSKIDVNTIYNNIKNLHLAKKKMGASKPFVAVKMFETNIDEEKNLFIERFKDISDEVFFEKLHNWSDSDKNYAKSYYNTKKDAAVNDGKKTALTKKVCAFPFYSMVINPKGDVITCCLDYGLNTKVGNVKTAKLEEQRVVEFLLNAFREKEIFKR